MASRRDSRIVKLVFAGKDKVLSEQVFAILENSGIAVPEDVDGLQALQVRNSYDMGFTSDSKRMKGVTLLGGVEGLSVIPYDRSVWVTIVLLPFEVGEEKIRSGLSRFGKVLQYREAHFASRSKVANGTRQVRMEILEDIPSSWRIAGYKTNIYYPGQPRTCFQCGLTGHEKVACPNKKCSRCNKGGHDVNSCTSQVVCFVCGKEGHFSYSCPSSYSAKVSGGLAAAGAVRVSGPAPSRAPLLGQGASIVVQQAPISPVSINSAEVEQVAAEIEAELRRDLCAQSKVNSFQPQPQSFPILGVRHPPETLTSGSSDVNSSEDEGGLDRDERVVAIDGKKRSMSCLTDSDLGAASAVSVPCDREALQSESVDWFQESAHLTLPQTILVKGKGSSHKKLKNIDCGTLVPGESVVTPKRVSPPGEPIDSSQAPDVKIDPHKVTSPDMELGEGQGGTLSSS